MRMVKLAKSHLAQAEARVEAAKGAFRDGNHPFTLRLCQEAVEMGLKASLRLVGVEYPKKHDVSGILIDVGDRFPEWFRDQIPFLVDIKSPERKPPTSVAGLARLYKRGNRTSLDVDGMSKTSKKASIRDGTRRFERVPRKEDECSREQVPHGTSGSVVMAHHLHRAKAMNKLMVQESPDFSRGDVKLLGPSPRRER
ncbi:MAG: HEPN domain-containing protein [Candidatus Bathyarchaeia archaeon]